jgi:sRNA-binding regulator protein Hfq
LLRPFLGRRVVVKLLFGDEVEGTLSRVDKFEMLVTPPDGAAVIVFKGAVATIREAPAGVK